MIRPQCAIFVKMIRLALFGGILHWLPLQPPGPPYTKGQGAWYHPSFIALSRNALAITLNDESAMAAAAIMGESSRPKTG